MFENNDQLIMISSLEHYSYCPRQCALIYIEQEFTENVHTLRGQAAHRHVDDPHYHIVDDKRTVFALPLFSERLGIIGKADAVEFAADSSAYPVEYKHGSKRKHAHDDIQLTAQAICLEEMTGKPVPLGAIYHVSSRRRREVIIDEKLRTLLEKTVVAIRELYTSKQLPPAVNDARCKECSLHDICQPEALAAKSRLKKLLSSLYVEDELCNKS